VDHRANRVIHDDRAVKTIGGVMGKFDQEQELQKRMVLAVHIAVIQPALGDRQHLREQPRLDFAVELVDGGLLGLGVAILAEVLFESQLASKKATSLIRRFLSSSSE